MSVTPIGIRLTLQGQKEVSDGLKQVGSDVNQLSQAGGKLGTLSQGMDKNTLSAKQLQAAMNQLPMQLQDIVVSLQGGQKPLTVFLQQGSQIAGSFNGAGTAVKAMAGYVLGLVSSTTVLAGAVATLGVAYYQGSKEQDAWVRGIVTTGNASGVTTSQLREYARQIDAVVGTQRQAAAALNDFVSAGVRGGDELRRYTEAAMMWERATGQAVATTAKQFADLQSEPLQAVIKLNEGTNFLTVSVYEQIKALEEQGDKMGASRVAMDALESTMRARAAEIDESLGSLERGWNAITKAAKEGWDAMLGIGRASTVVDEIARVTQELDKRMTEPLAVDNPAMRASREKGIAYLQRELMLLQDKLALDELSAAAQAESARQTQARIAFDNKYSKALEEQVTLQQKLARARAEAEAAGKTEAETQKVLAYVTEEHNKSLNKGESAAKQAQTSYQTLLSAINQKIVAMREEVSTGEKLTEAEKLRARYQEELLTKGRQFTAQQRERIEAALAALDAEEKQAIAARELAKAHEADAKALERLTAQRERSLATLRQSVIAAQDEERAAAMAAASNISHAEAVARLAYARADDLYQQARANGEAPETLYFLEQERQARQRLVEVMSQRTVREANDKAAKEAARAWDKVSRTIGDTLADYIMAGGKDAAQYLKRLFATLVLQPVVNYGVQGAMGMLGMGPQAAGASSVGNALGTVNNLSSLYSAFSGGLVSSVGGAIGSLGATFGSSALTSFAAGMKGSTLAAGLAGPTTAGAGGAMGLGASFGAALPWLAGGLAIASLFGGSFGSRGANHSGGAYSTKGGNAAYQLGLGGDALRDFTSRGNASIANSVKGLVTTTVGAFDYLKKYSSTYKGVDVAAGFAVNPRYSDEDAYGYFRVLDKVAGKLLSNYVRRDGGLGSDTTKAWSTYSADLIKAVYGQFKKSDITGWVKDELAVLDSAASLENLTAAVQAIAVIDAAFADFAKTVDGMQDLSGAVQTVLLRTSGGIEALSANVATYYQAFYSEQERAAKTAGQLAEALKEYGVELPTTAEQYRKLVEQQLAAGESGAELAAVLLGMSGTFKEVSDVWQRELEGLSGSATSFFGSLKDAIKSLIDDVSDDRKSILRGTGVMTAEELRAAIGAISTVGPSLTMVSATQTAAIIAAQRVAAAEQASKSKTQLVAPLSSAVDKTKQEIAALDKWFAGVQSSFDSFIAYRNWAWSGAGKYSESMALVPENARRQAQYRADKAQYDTQMAAAQARLAQEQAALNAATSQAAAYAQQLAEAQRALAAAQQAEQQARIDYAAEMAKWVEEAGVSVSKLSDLRGEVVSFYESQVQAVQAMLASAGNLRAVVDAVRMSQLSTAQTAQELGARYTMDYSMALATTGTVRAGYVDRMASNLGALSEAMRAEAATGEEWRVQTARLLAQASNVAGLLEGDAESTDYQEIALDLLGDIDAKLAELSGVATSGENLIVEAIKAGTASNMEGLRAIVAALKGETIPTFATGGWHAGGLRIVGERGPELEVTGPSRIWNHQQLQSMLGSGGNADEVRALRAELQQQRQENQAHAMAMLDVMELVQRVLNRWDLQGMPEERPAQVVQA